MSFEDPTANKRSSHQLDEHEIHDILRNKRRVHVIEHLKQAEGTITLRELAEQVAELETGTSPPPRNIRESVYNALHQTHLPKLDDLSVIKYEPNRKLITLADNSQQVDMYMEVVPPNDVPWAMYYWILGALMLAVIGFSNAGVFVFAALSVPVWIGIFFVFLTVSAMYQKFDYDGVRIDLL